MTCGANFSEAIHMIAFYAVDKIIAVLRRLRDTFFTPCVALRGMLT